MIKLIKRIINELRYDRLTTTERLMVASNAISVSSQK